MLEWAAYPKHLQLILLVYNLVGAPTKLTILRYFQEGLRSSILTKLQNEDHKLKSFVQIVKKAVVAKAKANLWSRATTKNIDQHCFWNFWSANSIAAKASA